MKDLIKAAKELNDVLGIEPAIKTVGVKADVLEKTLLDAAKLIDWDSDEISDKTKETLLGIGVEVPGMEPEGEEPEGEEEELINAFLATNKLKDLKAMVGEYDKFKPLRKTVAGEFDPHELKQAMAKLLGITLEDEYEDVPPAPAPKPPVRPAAKAPAAVASKELPAWQEVIRLIVKNRGITVEEINAALAEKGLKHNSVAIYHKEINYALSLLD